MNPQVWWYLTRASGIVAWLMLTASVIWGIVLSTKAFPEHRRPAWLLDLHRWLGGLAGRVHRNPPRCARRRQLRPLRPGRPARALCIVVPARCRRARCGCTVVARRRRSDLARHETTPPPGVALDPPVELRRVPTRQSARRIRRHRHHALAVPGHRSRLDHRGRMGNRLPPHSSPSAPTNPGTTSRASAHLTTGAPHGNRHAVRPACAPADRARRCRAVADRSDRLDRGCTRAQGTEALRAGGLRPRARRHGRVGLAQQSGESLEGQVKKTEQVEEHTEHGQTVLPWAIAVTIVSAAVAAEPYLRDRLGKVSPKVVAGVLISASVIAGGRDLDRDRSRPLRCHLGVERRHRRRLTVRLVTRG